MIILMIFIFINKIGFYVRHNDFLSTLLSIKSQTVKTGGFYVQLKCSCTARSVVKISGCYFNCLRCIIVSYTNTRHKRKCEVQELKICVFVLDKLDDLSYSITFKQVKPNLHISCFRLWQVKYNTSIYPMFKSCNPFIYLILPYNCSTVVLFYCRTVRVWAKCKLNCCNYIRCNVTTLDVSRHV